MKLKTLLEKFETSLKAESGTGKRIYTEVFRNPSPKEFLEASKKVRGNPYIRFIAPKDGSALFVFRPDVFHGGVYDHLENEKKLSGDSGKNLWGTAVFKNGKWIFDGSDEGVPNKFNWKALESKGIYYEEGTGKYGSSANPKDIAEAFEAAFTHPITKEYVEVFSNPTAKEMNEAARKMRGQTYVRFIADGSAKRLYVFSPLVIHRAAAKQIKRYSGKGIDSLPSSSLPRSSDLWGVAKKSGSGWQAVTSDVIEGIQHKRDNVLEQDWSWLNKKIDVSPLIKKIEGDEDTSSEKLEPVNMRSKAKKVEESIQNFVEEFVGADKTPSNDYVEIFVNPTIKEMRELPGQLRYSIDGRSSKLKVYVWDANLLHEDASKVIKVPYPHPQVLWGIGIKDGNKVISRGGIYPARNALGRYSYLKDRAKGNPEKYASEMKDLEKLAKSYLEPKWETKWVDLSDFKEAVREMLGNYIDEAFATGIKTGTKKYYEVFKNPTRKEIQELPEDVRFLIDARKGSPDVYVWSANLLHRQVARELNLPYPPDIETAMIYGAGEKSHGQIKATDSFHIIEYIDMVLEEKTKKREAEAKKMAQKMSVYLGPKFENEFVYLGPVQRYIRDFLNTYDFKINEAFETYAGKGEDTVIFKNPTRAEMREFGQYLRFIIRNRNNKNEVFVFSDGLMHAKAADELGMHYPNDPNILAGIAVRRGKDWVMMDSFNLRSILGKSAHNYFKMLETDWSNSYINVKDYMAKQARKKK